MSAEGASIKWYKQFRTVLGSFESETREQIVRKTAGYISKREIHVKNNR